MENSDLSEIVKCGNKRNFDVAFLSGENDIDREEKDGRKKHRVMEERTERPTSPVCKFYFCVVKNALLIKQDFTIL
jgi:hypothetical protein